MTHELDESAETAFLDRPARVEQARTRPLLWSIKRELWENRSIVWAPAAMSVFAITGFMITTIGMPERRRAVLQLPLDQQRSAIGAPYDFAAAAMFATMFVVAFFYCLDSLHGERRDRTILFWKSLPLSDRVVVLSKAIVVLGVLPAIGFTVAFAIRLAMLLWTTVVLLPSGQAVSTWTVMPWLQDTIIMAYGFVIVTLWHAPIYGWLTLVSAWARRVTVLWAVLPIVAAAVVEHVAFGGKSLQELLRYRLLGVFAEGFELGKLANVHELSQLTPGRLAAAPGLWAGLLAALIFFAAAAQMRRRGEPI